jgi:hypothetical protein
MPPETRPPDSSGGIVGIAPVASVGLGREGADGGGIVTSVPREETPAVPLVPRLEERLGVEVGTFSGGGCEGGLVRGRDGDRVNPRDSWRGGVTGRSTLGAEVCFGEDCFGAETPPLFGAD